MKSKSLRTIVVVALLVTSLMAVSSLAATVGAADEPETADEYFELLRDMEGTEAFETYDEFETIRTFAISQVQETGELDESERAELDAVVETLRAFDEAYEEAEDGAYEDSLEAAEETEAAFDDLEETQAALADLALTRFYEGLGDGLHERSEEADRTADEIELLNMTVTAYERADRPDEAAEFRVQLESRSAEYERDLERIEEAQAETTDFLDSCVECSTVAGAVGSNVLETFEDYRTVQEQYVETVEAETSASAHGLEEDEEVLAAMSDDLAETRTALAVASASVLIGYGLVVGLVGALVLGRIFRWRRTYDAAQVGSVVQIGENNV